MTRRAAIAGFVVLLAGAACRVKADGPPRIEVDRTPCAHCGMLISEPAFAAAYRSGGSDARIFDDVGCLLRAVRGEANPEAVRFWFHDAAAAVWIDQAEAVFVRSARLRTPMASGLLAYRGPEAAAGAAATYGGEVVGSLAQLLKVNP